MIKQRATFLHTAAPVFSDASKPGTPAPLAEKTFINTVAGGCRRGWIPVIVKVLNRLFTTQIVAVLALAAIISSCHSAESAPKTTTTPAAQSEVDVSTVPVKSQPVAQYLTLSSELVPDQEIDVYAKVAGYVKTLNVDYGTRVKKGQVMAILEVPELQATLDEDNAAIKAQQDQVTRAQSDVDRAKAQHQILHLQYQRLHDVQKTNPHLVAQQEVDDAQGKDLAAESATAAAQGVYQGAQSQLAVAKARLSHDQALFDYSRITAPFDGVVTQRYANLGALMQAGTSSTQATPLVRLSKDDVLRLVIPVAESDVKYIHVGDPVGVRIPSMNENVKGKVARFADSVSTSTRTMHTEVDVPNPSGRLFPGTYAEADVQLNRSGNALVVPLQALDRSGDTASVMVVKDNRIETRKVTPGIQMQDVVEIDGGLSAGDQVVVSERGGLKDGQTVVAKPLQAIAWQEETSQK
ncbi:MAG TPA: efflux RND transporter periplasmic adaptor subunit [Bryobacteraceae bacterium]|nr:efflux RND transporter periplasmic adaptor subunit [Bryobacteraceae bacterium]